MAIVAGGIMLVVAGITAAIKGLINFGKKLVNLKGQADSIGTSVNGFQAMSVAAMSCGLSTEKVIQVISKLTNLLSQAANGGVKYADAFHSIGLSWLELKKISPERQFAIVAKRIAELNENGIEIPYAFTSTMGEEGMRTLKQAGKGFEKSLAFSSTLKGIDPQAVESAQHLMNSMGMLDESFTSFLSSVWLVKGGMDALAGVLDWISEGVRGASNGGRWIAPNSEFSGEWSSIRK